MLVAVVVWWGGKLKYGLGGLFGGLHRGLIVVTNFSHFAHCAPFIN